MHVDAEALALIALGEPAGPQDAAHVAACAECSDEVASLAAVVAAGRAVASDDALVPAPPQVWDRISAELGLGGTQVRSQAVASDPTPPAADATGGGSWDARTASPVTPLTSAAAGVADHDDRGDAGRAPDGVADAGALAPVVPLRRRTTPWVAAAAAAGVLVGGAGGAWLVGRDTTAAPEVVAEAALEPLPGWDASGQAVVEVASDGSRTLVLELDGDGGQDAFREVWLIDRDVTRLVSLGVLEGDSGRFTVPSGLDLSDFVVVDVSEEPFDGDPAHSGDSIIRGLLET